MSVIFRTIMILAVVSACSDSTALGPAAAGRQTATEAAVSGTLPQASTDLRRLLDAPGSLPGVTDRALAALRRHYAARAYKAHWTDAGSLNADGLALFNRLAKVEAAGRPELGPIRQSIAERLPIQGRAAEIEVLLSAAFEDTAIDLRHPGEPGLSIAALDQAGKADTVKLIRSTLPVDPAFWTLRASLAAYRKMAAGGEWPTIPPGPKLERGDVDSRVAALRERLLATGDLQPQSSVPGQFDEILESAVRRFQERHGLAADGVVGPETLDAMNVPIRARIAGIELNLYRLAAEQREWGDRYVAVNVAGARYRLVEDGKVLLEGPAVVGRPSWPTPRIDSVIDRLEFNPSWNVPPRIAALEIWPKVRRDPSYFRHHDMHVVNGQIRQDPGPMNPLGQVKFVFDNPYSVYLHDTNNKADFDRAARFKSHGCVRVFRALDLARKLLAGDPAWSDQEIDDALGRGRTVRVTLTRPIPVHIVYDTAWVDDAGAMQFRDDVYGRDRALSQAAVTTASGTSGSCGMH